MFKIENVQIYGLEESIRRSGFPMLTEIQNNELTEKDYKRAKNLASVQTGTGHDCWLKGIKVQFDLTASQVFWIQWLRYHFHDIISSQSKMHRIIYMDLKKQCNQWVKQSFIDELQKDIDNYKSISLMIQNSSSEGYKAEAKKHLENLFYTIIYNIPSGLELTAGVDTNYLQLKTNYQQRKNHKLKHEWGKYCEWIETLPMSYLITMKSQNESP